MSFESDLAKFGDKLERRAKRVFIDAATEVHRSVQTGSVITGAPGQPVQTGALRASWQLTFPAPNEAHVVTAMVYAPVIEDAIGRFGALVLRSSVGGFHSVKITRAGWHRIVDAVRQRMTG